MHKDIGDHAKETLVTFDAVGSLADLQAAVAKGGNYYLSADIDTKDMLKIEKDLTLCLNGHSIKLEQAETNANTPVICWSEDKNATFTLTDCEPAGTAGTITHKSGKYGGGVNAYGTFNMYGG